MKGVGGRHGYVLCYGEVPGNYKKLQNTNKTEYNQSKITLLTTTGVSLKRSFFFLTWPTLDFPRQLVGTITYSSGFNRLHLKLPNICHSHSLQLHNRFY